ncbi:GPI-anchored protein 58 [Pyrus ussuriensis x Pyrus communis]|uniref:GPI-anchored protein 58 n=1 Tax=Pyrus ussuriensis x Pyrus communis TaxID=2448454 RepID=A0A5N5GGK5_9ROSA|nr:GPI-anchored protein 58 [Pyrus ussuriensis x Pyrus communis]
MLDELAGKSTIPTSWLVSWASFRADFFSASAEEISNKLFGERPNKILAPKSKEVAQDFPGGCAIKRVDVVVMVIDKKKLALPPKKTTTPTLVVATAAPIVPSKRPSLEAWTTVVAPMVEELATSKPTVALVDVGPVAATLEKAATTTERNPSPNPKKNPVIVLEEELRRVKPPATNPLPLDKGKDVVSLQSDLQLAVEVAG